MILSEFKIGTPFYVAPLKYLCTDIGTRTVVAILMEPVEVINPSTGEVTAVLKEPQARAANLFKGPPYLLPEVVFDEEMMDACDTIMDPDFASDSEEDTDD